MTLYITRFSAWALGIESSDEWKEWANGKRQMHYSLEPSAESDRLSSGQRDSSPKAPEIAFTDLMFRRRLSQISKMTIQVIYDLMPLKENTKIIFLSFRGELSRQFKVNMMQVEEGSVMPAAFSLSVFNAPPALASMALGLKGGYSALYPGGNSFGAGLSAAGAALLAGTSDELIVVYADEEVPPEYASLLSERPFPFAFSCLLCKSPVTGEHGNDSISLSSVNREAESPAEFLKSLILLKEIHVPP